jgi:hypothetical protein
MSRRPSANQSDNLGGITTGDGSDARNLTIRNCVFHDIHNQFQFNSCVGNLYDSGNTLIVEFCTFYNAGAACYPKNRTGSLTFRYNFVYACRCGLQTPWAVNSAKFSGSELNYHNNLVISQHHHGGKGFQQGQVIGETWNYYNNTFIQDADDASGCTYLPIESAWGSSCRMNHYNNIYDSRGNATQGIFIANSAATPSQIFTMSDFNLFNPMAATLESGGGASTLAQWRTLVQGRDANSLAGAPTYAVGSGIVPANYRLATGSAGRGVGRIGGTLAGAATDMGCWGGGATRIGADFAITKVPQSPVLTSVI